ncbi:hypothetical protein CC80DRAFT_424668, partial [Byssothecium circinans]
IQLDNLFKKHGLNTHMKEISLLYLLKECNLPSLIRAYPSVVSYLKVKKERYRPPLFAALATRSKEAF